MVVAHTKHVLGKLAEGNTADWTKDEALDLIYWLRQLMGLIAGVAWGYIPLPGLIGFFGFMALNVGAVTLLYKSVMGIEDDEWENAAQELMSEGMPMSMSAFMVMWVLSYTYFHT